MIFIKDKPDTFGAFASTLCLIHCIATPFVFIAQSCALSCCHTAPTWWKLIDYFFLIVSFFAIKQTVKTTTNNTIKPLLWIGWSLLLIIIVNETAEWLPLNENVIYIPAIALVILHLYNRKYCQCSKNTCCTK